MPRTAACTIASAGALCVAYGTFIERHWYRRRRVTLDRSATGSALKILHLSDIHHDPPDRRQSEFVASLQDVEADLVVLTGDLLGWSGVEDETVALLTPLTGPGRPGVAILGTNDRYKPQAKNPIRYFTDPSYRTYGELLDTERLVAGLRDGGYYVLSNEQITVDTKAGPVGVSALDDPHETGTVLPAANDVRVTSDVVARLGIVHAPYVAALDILFEAGCDLMLAGHTHGGQVRFPPMGALFGNCDLPLDQIRGESKYRDRWLHVSPGLGVSRYAPFRFACRPEATVIELAI